MGQEQIRMVATQPDPLSHSRRKNIFTNTPSHSQAGNQSNNGSRIRKQEPVYAQSVNTPVRQYHQEQVRSQSGMARTMQNLLAQQDYEELPPAERYPTRLSYFNAWSLPIQKYYIEERSPYEAEDEEAVVEARQHRQMRQINTGDLQGLMAERMKEEIITTKKRRQNLNMV